MVWSVRVTLTSIGFVGRVTYNYEEYFEFPFFFCTIESSDGKRFLLFFCLFVSINVTRSNLHLLGFHTAGFLVRVVLEQPLHHSSPHSFSDIKLITTYENEFIFSDLTAFYLTISFENICTLKRGTSSRIQIIVTFI